MIVVASSFFLVVSVDVMILWLSLQFVYIYVGWFDSLYEPDRSAVGGIHSRLRSSFLEHS